jgi:hypothetical protein
MNYDAQTILIQELDTNENLLWAGIPKQGLMLQASDTFMIPFSLVWGGFALFWETMALSIPSDKAGPVSIVFPLFGLPFVLIGLYIMVGRFFYDAKKRSKTFYGLTNKRIIIVSYLFGKTLNSLNLKNIDEISIVEKANGSGTITLGKDNVVRNKFSSRGNTVSAPELEMIDNAKQVYNLIRQQQDQIKQ